MKREMSSRRRPTNLRAPHFLNIYSTDRILRMLKHFQVLSKTRGMCWRKSLLFPAISWFRCGEILFEDWADPTLLELKKLQSSRFLCLRSVGLRKMRCSRWWRPGRRRRRRAGREWSQSLRLLDQISPDDPWSMSALFGLWDCVIRRYESLQNTSAASANFGQANVTHPELGVTVQLPIISVKKNPQNPMYTQLGVLTRGTIIEVRYISPLIWILARKVQIACGSGQPIRQPSFPMQRLTLIIGQRFRIGSGNFRG